MNDGLSIALITFEIENTENLPPRLMCTALNEQGHRASVHPLRVRANAGPLLRQVLNTSPDMLVFYLRYPMYSITELALAILARKWGFTGYIACFGPLAVFQTDWVLAHASGVDGVIGVHAEFSLCELAATIARNGDLRTVPSLTTRIFSNPANPTGESPCWRPTREAEPGKLHGVSMAKVVSTRGCQYRCAYCIHAALARHRESQRKKAVPNATSTTCLTYRRVQRRPMSDLIDEMKSLYSDKGVRYFFINDENPVPLREQDALDWADFFRTELRRNKMTNVALGLKPRADQLTARTVDALVNLGVVRTLVGVETCTDDNLKTLGRKGSSSRSRAGMEMLSSAGVITLFNSLLIHPGATASSIAQDLDFLKTVEHGLFKMVAVRPYAGTEIRENLQQNRRLHGGEFLPYVSYDDPVVQRFSELSTLLDSRVLGARDPFFTLLDLLLGAKLNQTVGDRTRINASALNSLWASIGDLNHLRADVFSRLLDCAMENREATAVFTSASREFGALHRHISTLGKSLYASGTWMNERHFRAIAAATTLAVVLQGAGCNSVDAPVTDSEDTSTDDSALMVDTADTESETDSETETDTELLWCEEIGEREQRSKVNDLMWRGCGGSSYLPSGICFYMDEDGRFLEVVAIGDSEADAELTECYQELFADEQFPCLNDDVVFFQYMGE